MTETEPVWSFGYERVVSRAADVRCAVGCRHG